MTSISRQINIAASAMATGALLALLSVPAAAQDAEPTAEKAAEKTMWDRVSQRLDADGDGQVTAEEFERQNDRFSRMDRNQDGVLTAEDFEGVRPRGRHIRHAFGVTRHLMHLADSNQDQQLSREEWTGFLATLDSDTDGTIRRSELEAARPADAPTPPAHRPAREIELQVERLHGAFDHLDRNNDGVISEDEQPRRRGRERRGHGPRHRGGASMQH